MWGGLDMYIFMYEYNQYTVGSSFALITARIRFCMLKMASLMASRRERSLVQIRRIVAFSSCFVLMVFSINLRLMRAQMFSIGFRSGLLPGHGRRGTLRLSRNSCKLEPFLHGSSILHEDELFSILRPILKL